MSCSRTAPSDACVSCATWSIRSSRSSHRPEGAEPRGDAVHGEEIGETGAPRRGPVPGASAMAALFAASFAALYLEVSLMKLAAVMYSPLFVYPVIGVALLGYGAAGSLLAARGGTSDGSAASLGRWLTAFAAGGPPPPLSVAAVTPPPRLLFAWLPGLPPPLRV